ncbi:hypothetical protein K2X96_00040 [Patescibacteria group bacterium]|nr:hypothetical protein [Patescibacteria group bacterium]
MKNSQHKEDDGRIETDFFETTWKESWTYIKTVVDVVREPVLILDKDLVVLAGNECFYHTFKASPDTTIGKIIYQLGNGQWDIPALRKLLEEILPNDTFFQGFEVSHEFPDIGHKVMLLNARRIHLKEDVAKHTSPIIMLAMEDVTEMMGVAELLARHTTTFEETLTKRTTKLETLLEKLETQFNPSHKEDAKNKEVL